MRIDFEKLEVGKTFKMTTVTRSNKCSIYQPNTTVASGKATQTMMVMLDWMEDRGEYLYIGYHPVGKDSHLCGFGATRLYHGEPKEFGVVGFEALDGSHKKEAPKKFADINRRFTEVVSDFLANGYTMNLETMAGSQGEVGKVDLTDGKKVIRVLLDDFRESGDLSIEGLQITVGEAEGIAPNTGREHDTIWNKDLKVIHTEFFYLVGENRRSGKVYGSREWAKAAADLRLKRYIARTNTRRTENIIKKYPQALDVAKRIIRREFGVKRIQEDDACLCKCDGAYVVSYHGKVYRLRNKKEG